MTHTIIITMDGGVIQNIDDIPPGIVVAVYDYDIEDIDLEDYEVIGHDDNGDTFTIIDWKTDPDDLSEGQQASGRLIAAAEDLLAACRQTLACIEAEWGGNFLPYNLSDESSAQANAAVRALRAAIAKATTG